MCCHSPTFLVCFLSLSLRSEAQLEHICVLSFSYFLSVFPIVLNSFWSPTGTYTYMYCHSPTFSVSFISFSLPSEVQLEHIYVLSFSYFLCVFPLALTAFWSPSGTYMCTVILLLSNCLSYRSQFLLKPNCDIYIYSYSPTFLMSFLSLSLPSEPQLGHKNVMSFSYFLIVFPIVLYSFWSPTGTYICTAILLPYHLPFLLPEVRRPATVLRICLWSLTAGICLQVYINKHMVRGGGAHGIHLI
jgi:hypothetical protein